MLMLTARPSSMHTHFGPHLRDAVKKLLMLMLNVFVLVPPTANDVVVGGTAPMIGSCGVELLVARPSIGVSVRLGAKAADSTGAGCPPPASGSSRVATKTHSFSVPYARILSAKYSISCSTFAVEPLGEPKRTECVNPILFSSVRAPVGPTIVPSLWLQLCLAHLTANHEPCFAHEERDRRLSLVRCRW